jgi:choline monooxygenase
MASYHINKDIKKAETLPSSFYTDEEKFRTRTETIFSSSWQLIGDQSLLDDKVNVMPFVLNKGIIDEPIVAIKEKTGEVRCLSNVCTHRGNLLIAAPGKASQLVCGYHGRRFTLDGKVEFMPEFDAAEDFPRSCDHLAEIPLFQWKQFYFVSLSPKYDFSLVAQELNERLDFLELSGLQHNPELDKTYQVRAHWALYCDNYLEGFHIPFVHPGLNQAVEYNSYTTVLQAYSNLQIGYAKDEVEAFKLPKGHPDYGQKVAAYYYWIFPNLMMNFYPWGLSVNIIHPKSPEETEVEYKTYILDKAKLAGSAGAALDEVEMEDEAVVEAVQQGMKSRFYSTGRFSPTKEKGVHHFHSLIAKFLPTDS